MSKKLEGASYFQDKHGHPPIHSPAGVSYWDVGLQEYLLDPTPDINLRPDPEYRTKEFTMNPVTTKDYGHVRT